MTRRVSRRTALATLGGGLGLALAGCLGSGEEVPASSDDGDGSEVGDVSVEGYEPPTGEPVGDDVVDEGGPGPPLAEGARWSHDPETLREHATSGGVGKDGIPSVDDPSFAAADEAPYDDGDPVFGVVWDGEARAYPQSIVVWHEVVNDEIAGLPVAVTYCPLTGTAQGFRRGPVEFGVSGRLVNSNLVMYDRGTDAWWPQVAAGGVTDPHQGDALAEFELTWTTWGRWRRAYPDTAVMTDDTGYTRRYDDDPYGEYNPRGGYYDDDRLMFAALVEDDRLHPKRVVIGTRTDAGALAVEKDRLRDEGVVEATVGGEPFVAVYDRPLDTGYTYRNPEGATVEFADGMVAVDGEEHRPHDLPLERTLRIDAMWFAWVAYYPDTELRA